MGRERVFETQVEHGKISGGTRRTGAKRSRDGR